MKRISGFRLRLLAVVLLTLMPFSFIVFAEIRADHERAMDAARSNAGYIATGDAASVASVLDRARAVLTALSTVRSVRTGDWRDARDLCVSIRTQDPTYLNVGITDLRGNVVASGVPSDRRVNVSDRTYVRDALAKGGFIVGDYQVGRIVKRPMIVCAYPLHDGRGKASGVVYISLDAAALGTALRSQQLPAGAVATLFDGRSNVIARVPNGQGLVGRRFPEDALLRDATTLHGGRPQTGPGLDGVRRVYAFAKAYEQGEHGLYVSVGLDEARLLAAERAAYVGKLAALLLVSAVLLFAGFAVSDYLVSRPLRSLKDLVVRLAEGDLDARANLPRRGDEIGDLAAACDHMAESIGDYVGEIVHNERQYRQLVALLPVGVFVIGPDRRLRFANEVGLRMLGHDRVPSEPLRLSEYVSEQECERLTQCVREAFGGETTAITETAVRSADGRETIVELACSLFDDDEDLALVVAHDITERRQVDELKSDFLAMVSHELRTPLTTILGCAQLLQRDELCEPHQVSRLAGRIEERGEHMTELVEELLHVLQSQARPTSEKREVSVRAVVQRCIRSLEIPATHDVRLHAPRSLERVLCLPDELTHAVTNLITNAIKFSPEGGNVDVRILQSDGRTWISVEDEGIGVPEDARERIFERFAQADMTSTRSFGGFGVGLYIVRKVAEAHGGSVSVENRPDGGAVFTLEFPSAA